MTVYVGYPDITPLSQQVNYGQNASLSVTWPGGIVPSGSLQYQWYEFAGGSSYDLVSNATSISFSPIIYANKTYRCTVTGATSVPINTPNSSVTIAPFSAGTIILQQQPAFNTAAIINTSPASGGMCLQSSYSYVWEQSLEGAPWVAIGSSETSPINSVPLKGKLLIRRKVTCGSQTLYSNTLVINPTGYITVNNENQNYVREFTVVAKGYKTFAEVDQLPVGKKFVTTTYFDGLGRPIQAIEKETSLTASGTWNDMVKHIEYDALGRQPLDYLPYSSANAIGLFKSDAATAQPNYIQQKFGETNGFSKVDYENAPLNRMIKTYAPGSNLGGANIGISTSYELNNAVLENVRIWRIGFTAGSIPYSNTTDFYADGQLYKTVITDEYGKKVIEYKDFSGNVVLKKVQDKNSAPDLDNQHKGWACTYYVYDDFGRLRYIIPPKAVDWLKDNNWNLSGNTDIINELCFWNEYDKRGRLIRKKSAGQAYVDMVYDARDRLVYSQDGKQRTPGKWIITLHDSKDRVVLTGMMTYLGKTRDVLQSEVDANANFTNESSSFTITTDVSLSHTVSVNGNPLTSATGLSVLSIAYYDHYNYPRVKTYTNSFTIDNTVPADEFETVAKSDLTLGASTGSFVRVMDGTDKFLATTVYYDKEGAVIQTHAENYRNTVDVNTVQYDYAGRIRSSYTSHQSNLGAITIFDKNTFDKIGRVIKISESINGASSAKELVEYSYNEMGQLSKKTLAPGFGGTQLENLNYEYNLRGSLTYINKNFLNAVPIEDNYFSMELVYEKTTTNIGVNRFDGNLAGISWKTKGDKIHRKFEFGYDNLGQFTTATFRQKNTSGAVWTNDKADFTSASSYDINGNIKTFTQKGIVPGTGIVQMDNLIYTYDKTNELSNKLIRVTENYTGTGNGKLGDFKDGANGTGGLQDYEYNTDGQLVKDRNKEIGVSGSGIEYNDLGMPFKVTFDNFQKTITYTYDAAGIKLSKNVTQIPNIANDNVTINTTTLYVDDFIYTRENNIDKLEFFSHAEGRVRIIASSTNGLNYLNGGVALFGNTQAVYDYYIKDHLTNIRMILTEEQHQVYAKATMEDAAAPTEEAIFGQQPPGTNELFATRSPKYPAWTSNNSQKVSQLSSLGIGKKIGPNTLLRVMAGDYISAKTLYYYDNPVNNSSSVLNDVVNSIIGTITSTGKTGSLIKGNSSLIQNNIGSPAGPLANFLSNQPNGAVVNQPKAFITVLFFDEQFNFIDENSGYVPVQATGMTGSLLNRQSRNISLVRQAPQNGYVMVYVSNESPVNVYFDDFEVTHTRGRIIEENHYYPYGLKIAGISAKAMPSNLGGAKQNSRVNYGYQGDYSEEDMDAQWNEFDLRTYDPQIGRFTSIDPYDQFASPYLGMGNNPVVMIDPSGGNVFEGVLLGTVAGFVIGGGIGLIVDPENSEKYAYWGALLGGAGGYILSTPNLPNFYVGPDWSLVKGEGLSTVNDILNNAYLGSFIKSSLMEIFGLGKIVTIRGSNTVEINKQINNYFKSHPNASKIGNFTLEFHAGRYGSDGLSEKSFESIKGNFNENSTILMGNCFCGKSDYLDDISAMANGATTIGHYGYQNDLTFLLNGSLTGGNPNIMGSGHLNSDMFKHRIAAGGKIVKNEILATTHVSNSGRITLRELQSKYVNRKLRMWDKIKSRFLWILEAIFNPSK